MSAFKLTEVHGNILQATRTYSLAHAVSADLDNAKGSLASQFATIFGGFDDVSKQQIETGNMAVMEDGTRFIYFLVTKRSMHDLSTYSDIEAALICMRSHMRQHEILKVAMPRIGCGADRLDWQRVKKIIQKVFANEYLVEILIYEHSTLPSTPKCHIMEVKGSIFSAAPDVSLAHSVSADFSFFSGIAVQFKTKFGHINDLLRQNKHAGNVAVLKDNERYIYNLVTKERSHEKCQYPALYYALVAMREHMRQHNVTKVAVPALGCGIDHLIWCRVKQMLEYVFFEDFVEISAYLYERTRTNSIGMRTCHSEHCSTCKMPI